MKRHSIAAAASATIIAVLYWLLAYSPEVWSEEVFGARGDDPHWKLSMATGTTAVMMLGATLVIGPIRRLRTNRLGPVHLPWRRVLGVWSAFTAWVHVGLGATIHAEGWRVWVPFTHLWRSEGKLRILGATFFVGLGAALILVLLVATSNSRALRALGARRWKMLQRSTYVVFGVILIHVVGTQIHEGRTLVHVALTLSIFAVTMFVQAAGVRFTRRSTSQSQAIESAG